MKNQFGYPSKFPLAELYDPEKEKLDFWFQVYKSKSERKLLLIEAEFDIPDQKIQLQKLLELYKSILESIRAEIEKRRQEDLFGGYDDGIRTRIIRDGKLEEWLTTGSLSGVENSCLMSIVDVKKKINLLPAEEKREPQKEQTPGNGLRPKIKWLRSPACLERYLTELFRDKIESPSLVVLKKDFFCSGNKQGNIEKDGKIIPTKEPPRGYFPYVFSVSRDLKLIDFVVRPFYDKLQNSFNKGKLVIIPDAENHPVIA